MKRKFLISFFFLAIIVCTFQMESFGQESTIGQGRWIKKADFPGSSRYYGVGFSIGKKGYYGLGQKQVKTFVYKVYTDFWEYDSEKNSWTQKADFPGKGRLGINGFAVKDKIYVGFGHVIAPDGLNLEYQLDLYEFDLSANKWLKKNDANFGGGDIGFIIKDTLCFVDLAKRVLKKYNAGADTWMTEGTWSKKTNTPDYMDIIGNGTVFLDGKKVCIITGIKTKGKYTNQLWELDLNTITWSQKNDLPIPGSDTINVFYAGEKRYVLKSGKIFLEYDSASDTWKEYKEISVPNKNFFPLFTIENGCYGLSNHEFLELTSLNDEMNVKNKSDHESQR